MGLFSRKKTGQGPPPEVSISPPPSIGGGNGRNAHDPKHKVHVGFDKLKTHTSADKHMPSCESPRVASHTSSTALLLTSSTHPLHKEALEVPPRESKRSASPQSTPVNKLTPQSSADTTDSESGSEYEFEPHDHVVAARGCTTSQLSALMSFCGLLRTTRSDENDVPQRTVSLLPRHVPIPRLATDLHLMCAAVSERQVELISTLRTQLAHINDLEHDPAMQHAALAGNTTLYERYGVLTEVVGRGAYGVIRMAGPAESDKKPAVTITGASSPNQPPVYAVKELQQKLEGKGAELRPHFIDRVVSEFVLLLTFNSPHLVRALDLFVTLAPPHATRETANRILRAGMKVSQVMEYTGGGDLLSYCQRCVAAKAYLSIAEIDCMVKQISTGLHYMHQHGVAHCDVKLENILIAYGDPTLVPGARTSLTLKLSDFGKSNVFRTKWDAAEQRWPSANGPIGSEPYMAPEEHVVTQRGVSLPEKDCWGLGVVVLALFNLRQLFFRGRYGEYCLLDVHDVIHDEQVRQTYPSTLLWSTTAPKKHGYKDSIFAEYCATRMVASYSDRSKEWTIMRAGAFVPIERLFEAMTRDERDMFDADDIALRKYFIYKLLDPGRRMTARELIRGDWMAGVQCCLGHG